VAVQIIKRVLSDISGDPDAQHITFAYQGREYGIDLTDPEIKELEDFLKKYIECGVKLTPGRAIQQRLAGAQPDLGGASPYGDQKARKEYLKTVREWAERRGIELASRGRVPQNIIDMYENRHTLEVAVKAAELERQAADKENRKAELDERKAPKKAAAAPPAALIPAPPSAQADAQVDVVAPRSPAPVAFSDEGAAEPPAAAKKTARKRAPAKKATASV
jgi:hypothetical protein